MPTDNQHNMLSSIENNQHISMNDENISISLEARSIENNNNNFVNPIAMPSAEDILMISHTNNLNDLFTSFSIGDIPLNQENNLNAVDNVHTTSCAKKSKR
ncbi:14327_t:CDS:2, partial [Acaulospora colombiana]